MRWSTCGAGETITLPDAGDSRRCGPHPPRQLPALACARMRVEGGVEAYLPAWPADPVRLRAGPYPLADYQTVFAREPGSAEMPSAGRPFTTELVTRLVAQGVGFAPIVLHTGVSSQEAGEPPQPERFAVPEPTARQVNMTRAGGWRIVAVGTTATRALESAADAGSVVHGRGWTDLVLGPHRPAVVVDGLITGWHAPGASHLELLKRSPAPGWSGAPTQRPCDALPVARVRRQPARPLLR